MKRIDLEQGSPEWLQWRRTRAMASETSAIMGISPYQSPEQIRSIKRGNVKVFETSAMRHGNEQEPLARQAYERDSGEMFQPAVFEWKGYGASVDGINMDGDTILEIKSPVDGKDSPRWQEVAEGAINDYDFIQCQHQLMVTGAQLCVFLVWGGDEYVTREVYPAPNIWQGIQDAWEHFWPTVQERDDEEWQQAAETYRRAKKIADEAAAALAAAKQQLVELGGEYSYGAGVRVKQVQRAGQVDWKKIQAEQLADVDLDEYRKPGTTFYQVELVEEAS
jgi:putative phage-type endonuclease